MTTENGHNADGAESSEVAISDLEQKIIRQVEYYFGDYNLGKDKYLQEVVKEDDGWVKLEKLVTFNRLKMLSTDFETIVNSLKKSQANLLEISEDGTKIRRSLEKPLPENDDKRKEDIMGRSVYVKGFPMDASLDELLEFFKRDNAVEHLQMRYFDKKAFKGSVFVVFKNVEDADAFLKKESVKYGDTELLRETKSGYFKRKQEEKKQKKDDRTKGREKRKRNSSNSEEREVKPVTYEPGRVLYINGLSDNLNLIKLKKLFNEFAPVAWIEYNNGDLQAWVRFSESTAAEVVEKMKAASDDKLMIEETEITHRILEGDEELEFYKNVAKAKEDSIQKRSKNSRGRGRGYFGRGGRRRFTRSENQETKGKDDNEESKKRPAEEGPESDHAPKVAKTETATE